MGQLDVPEVLIEDLVAQFQAKGTAKISIAAWQNVSKAGESYLTMTGKLPNPIQKTNHQ